MSPMQLNFPTVEAESPSTIFDRPILALGFRPFFLLGAAMAALWVPLYMLAWYGMIDLSGYAGMVAWHGHEMLFGFAGAIIAGFLLTAVGNWTGAKMPSGLVLFGLVLAWILGRLVMLFAGSLPWLVTLLVDGAFFPLVAVAIARPILATKNKRNYGFIFLLGALTIANLWFHLHAAGLVSSTLGDPLYIALDAVVVIMVVVGGRVIPFFTRNAVGDARIDRSLWLDRLSIGGAAALLVADLATLNPGITAYVALFAGIFTAARMWRWGSLRTLNNSLLWVLHLSYAFIAMGLILRGLSSFVPLSASTHALTVGGVGLLTLGMMARVALGHTGRPLVVSPAITCAFVLMALAAALRVFVPIFLGFWYMPAILASSALWAAAFIIYFAVYWPILTRPRADGRAG
ncbi:MAG: NnrS family protein [Bradymonadaceae bacterium]